jgi:hypothetical protein
MNLSRNPLVKYKFSANPEKPRIKPKEQQQMKIFRIGNGSSSFNVIAKANYFTSVN